MSFHRSVPLSACLAASALFALTACNSDDSAKSAAGSPSASAPAAPPAAPSADGSGQPGGGASASAGAASKPAGGAVPGGGAADSDSYALDHPCAKEQLSITFEPRPEATTQRVIRVKNTSTKACGLSLIPYVELDSKKDAGNGKIVKPKVPDGMGGPLHALRVGKSAYAVLELTPGNAATGTATGIDEVDVLADPAGMPAADTLNFPLPAGTRIADPKLGMYRDNIADAAASAAKASVPEQS
jgi:hypothetical protein